MPKSEYSYEYMCKKIAPSHSCISIIQTVSWRVPATEKKARYPPASVRQPA